MRARECTKKLRSKLAMAVKFIAQHIRGRRGGPAMTNENVRPPVHDAPYRQGPGEATQTFQAPYAFRIEELQAQDAAMRGALAEAVAALRNLYKTLEGKSGDDVAAWRTHAALAHNAGAQLLERLRQVEDDRRGVDDDWTRYAYQIEERLRNCENTQQEAKARLEKAEAARVKARIIVEKAKHLADLALSRARDVEAQEGACRSLLRRFEWSGLVGGCPACPLCYGIEPYRSAGPHGSPLGHTERCAMDKALGDAS